ncbi:MAG: phosphoribosylformylglycinamidine synthase subunit PurQ [Thermodesulfobacteriota bacterium]|nr:phosphoribosylformylglycinamidine synthase subunit PurQ [Thermodesulfobacteriota bacterium]
MKKVKALVLAGNGINCEMEMAHACRLAGSDVVDIVFLYDILSGEVKLDDYHFLNLPGGFLDGDDLGAAKAMAHRLKYAKIAGSGERLDEVIFRFIREGKLILGVCNGFQLMVKSGLLPGLKGIYGKQALTLTFNDSGRFEDRWVYLKVNSNSPSIFTRGLKGLYLPVRHGEGKFIPKNDEMLAELERKNLIALQYSDPDYRKPTLEYPLNPNGSASAIAGICDETGRLFGMMPHPEAYLYFVNHPRWTREKVPEEGMGLAIFRNAVEYVRKNL